MASNLTLGETLQQRGISRRSFLKFCAVTASTLYYIHILCLCCGFPRLKAASIT